MARQPFTLEKNFDKVIAKIKEKPVRVMNIIGQTIVREVKAELKASDSSRRGMLIHSLGYWARKQERDLQIGFKMSIDKNKYGGRPGIVGDMLTRVERDPIYPVVLRNKDMIVQLIGAALDEIRRER
jgi:hypothetical protein